LTFDDKPNHIITIIIIIIVISVYFAVTNQVEFLETSKDSHSSDMLTSKLVEVVGDINPNFAVFGAGGRKGRQKGNADGSDNYLSCLLVLLL